MRKDGSAREMVGQAIADLGGIDSLIPAGSKVAIKVNGSWNGSSANTDPEVVREVVRIIRSRAPPR